MPKSIWREKLSSLLVKEAAQQKPEDNLKLIIESRSRGYDRITSLVESSEGQIHRELKYMPALAVEVKGSSLEELARNRFIKRIWHDAPVRLALDVAVPTSGGSQAQAQGFTGKGIVVALIDTGIYPHPDLTTPTNRILAWKDFVNGSNSPYDDNGHGTHVAGIIAGNGQVSKGKYRGMAPDAKLVGIKVMDANGNGDTSTLISAIEWCIANLPSLNIRVINLSLGSTAQESYRNDPLCRATTTAWRKGILVCAAAGNEGPEARTINSPGINPWVITVGNIDDQQTIISDDDRLNPTSSRGPTIDQLQKPDLIAPGTNITSLSNQGGYRSLSGTSMSAPLVAGAAAQILQKIPTAKPDQLKKVLQGSALDRGLGPDLQGAGELNLNGIFNSKAVTKRVNIQKALGYHLMKSMIKESYPAAQAIQTKFDDLIIKAVLAAIS